MAAPTLNNATSQSVASGTSIVATAPASIAVGDMLVAFVAGNLAAPVTMPAGWSVALIGPGFGSIYVKSVTATEPASYTIGLNASGPAVAVIGLVKGASGPNCHDYYAGSSNGTAATSYVCPAMIPAHPGELSVNFFFAQIASAITLPGGQTSATSLAANGVATNLGWENLSTTGSQGTRTATGGSAAWAGWGITFSPAIGSVGTGTAYLNRAFAIAPWASPIALLGNSVLGITPPRYSRPLPLWESADMAGFGGANSANVVQLGVPVAGRGLLTVDVSGTLSGIVTVAGVPTFGVMVEVLWRETGALIARVFTNAAGAWSIGGLRVGYAGYSVVFRSPSSLYNDIVYDLALPV